MANNNNNKGQKKTSPEKKPQENKKQVTKPEENKKQGTKPEENKKQGTKKEIEVVDFPVEKENEEKKDALIQAEEKSEALEEFKESLSPEKEKLLKKQGKEAKKAAKKNQKEAEKKRIMEEKEAKKAEKNSKAVTKVPEKQDSDNKQQKKQTGRNQYAAVMTTGQFVKAFILMLIPGVNIICILVWALGGSKNPNKVHFTRACLIFFLIEILLTAMLAGGAYIYANEHEAEYLKKANNYTNGLIEYMDIDSYKKLHRLRDIPDYLIDKNEMKKNKKEPIPETRVIENPAEIKSYDDFVKLYVKSMSDKTNDSVVVKTTGSQTKKEEKTDFENLEDPIAKKLEEKEEERQEKKEEKEKAKDKVKKSIEEKAQNPETLDQILKKYSVNPKKPGLVYIIIINNDKDNDCLIAFDPTGTIQKVPTIRMDNQIIYVGGVN